MPKIDQREYKMMLRADGFAGDKRARREAVRACWRDFRDRLCAEAIGSGGDLDHAPKDKRRNVQFFDTSDNTLRRDCGLVIRLRRRRDRDGRWDATLKFRSGDRIQSGHLRFRRDGDGKDKYEEDIKSPVGSGRAAFMSLYSRSSTVDAAVRRPRDIGDCLKPFRRLGGLRLPGKAISVAPVGGFAAAETVFEGGTIALPGSAEAECGLIVWTDAAGDPRVPVVAEFSFRYKLGKGKGVRAARRAWRAFECLHADRRWVDPSGRTKTAFVYDLAAA